MTPHHQKNLDDLIASVAPNIVKWEERDPGISIMKLTIESPDGRVLYENEDFTHVVLMHAQLSADEYMGSSMADELDWVPGNERP